MTSHTLEEIDGGIDLFLRIAAGLGAPVTSVARILDFGCGRGETVARLLERGYRPEGVDVSPFWQDGSGAGADRGLLSHLHLASAQPYRLPFDDATFDFAFSAQVFEHVMDYGAAFRELRRVLKPQAISIHIFPSRWRPVENHVKVPLATVIRSRPWLALWALLGIRNEFQQGLAWPEVVDRNYRFLRDSTAYPTTRAIRRMAQLAGVEVRFVPDQYVAHHPGEHGRLARRALNGVPSWARRVGAALFSAVTQRAMVVAPSGRPGPRDQ